jgi:hypothetical protein
MGDIVVSKSTTETRRVSKLKQRNNLDGDPGAENAI